MNMPIYVLNGPNLNRLGTREPEIYGTTTLAEIEAHVPAGCRRAARRVPPDRTARRSSSTGSTRRSTRARGIVINPAAYSFTSIAILDALKMFPGPIVELHISQHSPPRGRSTTARWYRRWRRR